MNRILASMVSVLAVAIASCDENGDAKIVNMRINHYKQPIINHELFYGFSFLVQEGGQMGNNQWYELSTTIEGFEYQPGYVYELQAKKEHYEPAVDRINADYSLIQVLSKTKVPEGETFDITLSIPYPNAFASFVTQNEMDEFSLLGMTVIDCGDLCDELEENLANQIGLIGTFEHADNESVRLLALREH